MFPVRRSLSGQPIRRLVWFFILLALTAGWITAVRQERTERRQAEQAAIEKAQTRALLLEQHVVRTLQAANLASLHLGYKYLSQARLSGGKSGLAASEIQDPVVDPDLFASASVANLQGDLVAASSKLAGPSSVRDHPVFKRLSTSNGTQLEVSGPHFSRTLQGRYIYASRAISSDGVRLGYATLQMTPSQLLNFPEQANFEGTDLVSVISLDAVTLARREGDLVSAGEQLSGKLVMQMQERYPNGTYLGPSSLDGHVRYFSHRRLARFPIFVTAGVSRSDAMAQVDRRAATYYLLMAGASVLFIGFGWVIHLILDERDRRTALTAEASRRLAEAQRVAQIGDWEYDLRTGEIAWSDSLCEMYERPLGSDRLNIAEYKKYVARRQKSAFQSFIDDVIRTGDRSSIELQVLLPSGRTVHRDITALPSRDLAGNIVRIYGTDQDITQKLLLHSLESKVAHLDRQRAMSMMAGTLAHEINQPLTAASNYLNVVRKVAAGPDHRRRDTIIDTTELAIAQIQRAAIIIRRVRAMVRNSTDRSSTASIPEVVESSLALLAACGVCRRGIVGVDIHNEISDVRIDPIQLQQVLMNLLRNAVDAAPADDPQIMVKAFEFDRETVQIEVVDNGPGFPQGNEEPLSPFESSVREQGLGLGLSISRTIIEYHEGSLIVQETAPGRTVVRFRLRSASGLANDRELPWGTPTQR